MGAVAGADWVRGVFAAMFAALAVFYLVRLFVAGRDAPAWDGRTARSVDVARGVMSLGMVTMLVPWVDPLPAQYWLVIFSVAAAHIAIRLIRWRVRLAPGPRADLGEQHEVHLMIGSLAMVYMLAAMPAKHDMAGNMDMPGMTSTGLALPVLTWAFVTYFLVFVVRLGTRLAVPVTALAVTSAGAASVDGGPRGVVGSPHLLGSSEVVMGVGMSYMLMSML